MAPTLVTDATAAPVDLIPMNEAVSHIVVGRAQALVSDETRRFRSAQLDIPAPLVISFPIVVAVNVAEGKRPTRRVIVARDEYRCQYCGREVTLKAGAGNATATIDHVKPKAKFAHPSQAHTWDNVTTACGPCNRRKADRLPMECGMYPKRTPTKPGMVAMRWAGRLRVPEQIDWVASYYRVPPALVAAG